MKKKVLAIASGGGHWKQLMLLSPSFNNHRVRFVTTIPGLPEIDQIPDYRIVTDSNKTQKIKLVKTALQVLYIILVYRPDVIISTGAAPGMFGMLFGKFLFKKTIWVDSIANAQELSLGGKLSVKCADIVLTQWENLADGKTVYKGSVF